MDVGKKGPSVTDGETVGLVQTLEDNVETSQKTESELPNYLKSLFRKDIFTALFITAFLYLKYGNSLCSNCQQIYQ